MNQFNHQTSPPLLLSGTLPEGSPAPHPRLWLPFSQPNQIKPSVHLPNGSSAVAGMDAGLLLILRGSSRWGRRVSAERGARSGARRSAELPSGQRGEGEVARGPRGRGLTAASCSGHWAPAGDIHDKLCERRRRALAPVRARASGTPRPVPAGAAPGIPLSVPAGAAPGILSVPAGAALLRAPEAESPSVQGRLPSSTSAACPQSQRAPGAGSALSRGCR